MMSKDTPRKYFDAEDLVADLFHRMGYRVRRNVSVFGIQVDMIIERDGLESPVEITVAQRPLGLADIRDLHYPLHQLVRMGGYVSPIICVLGTINAAAKNYIASMSGFRVWDIDELRERARPYADLHRRLGAKQKEIAERAAELIKNLTKHENSGGLSADEYERLCQKVTTFLFDPHLYGFERQSGTSDGANRYDFICRIRPGDPFWDAVRVDFRTRSILFECKNYSQPITADQIYSTERYLFSRALRTVCFVISRLGSDDSAKRAAQGAMRESGKLVLLVSNADLVRMLGRKAQNESPTVILDEMIWDFIIRLPR
jgi:hypothetical protein